MPAYLLLHPNNTVAHSFDAADNQAARGVLQQRCLADNAKYTLARKLVVGTPRVNVQRADTVDEENLP